MQRLSSLIGAKWHCFQQFEGKHVYRETHSLPGAADAAPVPGRGPRHHALGSSHRRHFCSPSSRGCVSETQASAGCSGHLDAPRPVPGSQSPPPMRTPALVDQGPPGPRLKSTTSVKTLHPSTVTERDGFWTVTLQPRTVSASEAHGRSRLPQFSHQEGLLRIRSRPPTGRAAHGPLGTAACRRPLSGATAQGGLPSIGPSPSCPHAPQGPAPESHPLAAGVPGHGPSASLSLRAVPPSSASPADCRSHLPPPSGARKGHLCPPLALTKSHVS